jgi:hypothetical protein
VTRIDRLDPPELGASAMQGVAYALIALGLGGLGWLYADAAPHAWSGLLSGMLLPLWIGVGALFFIAAHSLCGAVWVVPFRRVMEGLSGGVLVAAVLFLAIAALGIPHLYDWSTANPGRDALFRNPHGGKALWMTEARWIATGIVVLAAWILLRARLNGLSRQPGAEGAHARTSTALLVVLVPTFTLFTWDLVLSLHVAFVSAMFGVYCLVGAIQAFLAALALCLVWLGSRRLKHVVQPHLRHDVGTWLVGWACIVAYIGFAQYVIISFANMDEETHWYLMRGQHGYGAQYLFEAVLRCVVPFALLMSQRLRADPRAQALAGGSVLVGVWLDLHWLVVPAFSPNHYRQPFGGEFLVALGCLGALLVVALAFWRRHGLVPMGDARLLPAINAEHLS